MRELFLQLADDLRAGRQVAYCRLVETRGSTPQKAGALMLVYQDGGQAGTLGGGCVEADVKRRALEILTNGQAEIATFQLDQDYGWDDGLICGGRMKVLIQPISAPETADYFAALSELVNTGKGLTEAICYEPTLDLLPRPSHVLFNAEQQVIGKLVPHTESAVSDDQLLSVAKHLRPIPNRPRAYCEQGVAYLPVLPRLKLVIVGGGHVGQAVAELAESLDFDIWVVDDRVEYVREAKFPAATKRITGDLDETLPTLKLDKDAYCLIVTRGHQHDQRALFHLVQQDPSYLGLIGSRRKIRLIFDNLQAEGISAASLARVYAPLGIEIGSQTVPEIAVSICAELIAHRNCQGQVPGRAGQPAAEFLD